MSFVRANEIESSPISRAITGFDELTWLYGFSTFPDKLYWGMPKGKISLWAGETGIGKSRVAIALAKSLVGMGQRVLYFQTETDQSTFVGWMGNTINLYNLCCSTDTALKEIIHTIYEVKPQFVILDSVNEIDEFEYGSKQEARRLIKGEIGKQIGFKKACEEVGCHLILLAQLNQDKTIKGGTSLPHLVDIVFKLRAYNKEQNGLFIIKPEGKHRYGRIGPQYYSVWEHTDTGVKCITDYSKEDRKWCESHGKKVRKMKDHYKALQAKNDSIDGVTPNTVAPKRRSFQWKKFLVGNR